MAERGAVITNYPEEWFPVILNILNIILFKVIYAALILWKV